MPELMLSADARFSSLHDSFAFYAYQIVELTATLTLESAGTTDGLPVIFDNVGQMGVALAPYGTEGVDWYSVEGEPTRVLVYMKKIDARSGAARLRVLVVGTVSTEYQLAQGTTQASIQSSYRSNTLAYCTFGVSAHATSYPGILHPSDVDQAPWSSQGNYLYYLLQVTTDGSDKEIDAYTGLANMCIRLMAAGADQDSTFLENVLIYTDPFGPPRTTDMLSGLLFVDLVTDVDGAVEMYVCAKAKTTTCASVTCKAGTMEPEIGPILVADLAALDGSLAAPHCDNPVGLGAGASTAQATIPTYAQAQPGDQIFLFCNGRYQSSGVLPTSLELALWFQPGCVRSEDPAFGDQESNALVYAAAGSQMVRMSSVFPFLATGKPPAVQLDNESPEFPDKLAAPIIVEADGGWPINCETAASGLTVRVPIDSDHMKLGDAIVIHMTMNGYRLASNEPVGMGVPLPGMGGDWPKTLVVTSRALKLGYIKWRFMSYHFQGFGQFNSRADDCGAVGTLVCRYTVQRVGDRSVAYCSDILSIGIDTIPPDGNTGFSEGVPPRLLEHDRL